MAGELWVWGNNYVGKLGDNTTLNRSSPVQTIAGGSDWTSIAGGYGHTAAIKTNGTLWTWGDNTYYGGSQGGQLGDNTTIRKSSPIQTIAGGTNWSSVSCGNFHCAAIKTDGTLWVWGINSDRQLGDDTSVNKSSPVQTAAFGTNWSFVSCGNYHTAAIKTDGTLWLWGGNSGGRLGDNTTVRKSSPVQTVTGGTDWSKVACGAYHTAAIKTDGTLWVWGSNYDGRLGDNTTVNKSSPVQTITLGTNWSKIACGGSFTAAIKTDGALWCWGYNSYGQLGDNTVSVNKSSPIQTIAGGANWSQVECGASHAAAIKTDGTLWTWGQNSQGTLGDNTNADKSSPVQIVAGGTDWFSVACDNYFRGTTYGLYSLGPPPNVLSIATNPAYIYSGKQFGIQPVVNILDPSLVLDTGATDAVTVAVTSGNATISGTTTVNAISGVVTYSNLVLTGFGPVTLEFTASGITSTSTTVNVEISGAILPKRSETASSVPTSGQLLVGELALNLTDQIGYVKKSNGSIIQICNGAEVDGGLF
jgi:alpha-tubulin suppressor-like RCC1 family protein